MYIQENSWGSISVNDTYIYIYTSLPWLLGWLVFVSRLPYLSDSPPSSTSVFQVHGLSVSRECFLGNQQLTPKVRWQWSSAISSGWTVGFWLGLEGPKNIWGISKAMMLRLLRNVDLRFADFFWCAGLWKSPTMWVLIALVLWIVFFA